MVEAYATGDSGRWFGVGVAGSSWTSSRGTSGAGRAAFAGGWGSPLRCGMPAALPGGLAAGIAGSGRSAGTRGRDRDASPSWVGIRRVLNATPWNQRIKSPLLLMSADAKVFA